MPRDSLAQMARKPIELAEARRTVVEACAELPSERVPLEDALGRALAEEVRSEVAIPPFDNSSMDGFAIRAEDTVAADAGSPVRLRVVDESRAGRPAERAVGSGEAIRVATGAIVPAGADAILRQEDAVERNGEIESERHVQAGSYVRLTGEDVQPGQAVLAAGTALGPAELGVLASIGRNAVPCRRRPRVAVVTTGDELVDPGSDLEPGQIRDTNSIAVASLVGRAGGEVATVTRIGDDREATRGAVAEAIESDVAVICGGVSVGERDHVRPVLEELGTEQLFWGVALRPGRPTWFGVNRGGPRASGGLVFGLPGNPVSAVVTFLLFVQPALRALVGLDPFSPRTTAVMDQAYEKRPGRTHAVRVTLRLDGDGWHAVPTRPEQASHILTSMVGADALAIVPADCEGVAAGESVEVELI
jgi:molybdopterin molybdotransferase